MADKDIQISVGEVTKVWGVLNDMVQMTDNPFRGNARRLLFKLQPEIKFLQGADKEDIEAVSDKTIKLGDKIPPPDSYPDEYKQTLQKLCTGLPAKDSQIEKLVSKVTKNGKQEVN